MICRPLRIEFPIHFNKNKKSMTLEELAKRVDRDKSTVFRFLQKLVDLGICNKERSTERRWILPCL